MPVGLSKKVVLITGASSSIGRACAEQFARLGARLLLCARRGKQLGLVVADLKKRFQADVYSFLLDVRDPVAVEKQLHQLPEKWQAIDILVNNAGLALGLAKVQEGEIDDRNTMIDTNCEGGVICDALGVTNPVEAQ